MHQLVNVSTVGAPLLINIYQKKWNTAPAVTPFIKKIVVDYRTASKILFTEKPVKKY